MRKIVILVFLFFGFSLQAAGPICHAYLAQKYFENFPKYTKAERQEFMVGTLFPDIRYIAHFERSKTHFESLTIEDIANESSPFIAGMKFHSFVDVKREEFVTQKKMYFKYKNYKIPRLNSFFKMVEDEIAYDDLNRNEAYHSLNKKYPQEKIEGVDPFTIQKWHQLLQLSFSVRPSTLIYFLNFFGMKFLNLTPHQISAWNTQLKPFSISIEMEQYVSGMLSYIEEEMKRTPPLK